MNRAASALCVAALVGAAAYYALGVIRPGAEAVEAIGAYDIYAYFYPNIRYALDSLARGDGLLWNPYQDCGQPFFAISITGLLYPVNWVFALLPREPALLATIVLNLGIAGLGAWWLGREMGLTRPAALAGALAFECSSSALLLAAWSPMHVAPFAWMPVALAALERLLRAPTPRRGALLGVVLTLQLLPGFPQTSFFTYQLIALRVVWEIATARVARPGALAAWLAFGLAVPPLLAAVQFLPSLELARASIRQLPLQRWEIGTGIALDEVRASVGQGFLRGALTLAALAVAGIGLSNAGTRRLAFFYLLIATLSILLALGEATPLWGLYQRLPGGSLFRRPERFLWVTSLAVAMACGLGVEGAMRRGGWGSRAAAALALAAGVALFVALPPYTIADAERQSLTVVILAVAAAACWHRLAPVAGVVVALALAPGWLITGELYQQHRAGDIYGGWAGVLERVRARLTPQDRILLFETRHDLLVDFGLTHKVASLYRLPSIYDYEPLVSRRYAEYFTFMRTGRRLAQGYDWRALEGLLPPRLKRPLFDLTAARYVVVDASIDPTAAVLGDTAPEILREGSLRVYENRQALPRAFFVPAIRRVPADQVLALLGDGRVDPRRVALVGEDEETAWAGSSEAATGRVAFARDDPQTVAIDVDADAPGFLFLADQYDPGWTAEVDGTPTTILRANHAFRLVPVPGGRSQVVFRYRPRSVRIGAAVSLAAALLVAGCVWRGHGRQQRRDPESAGRAGTAAA